MVVLLTFRSIIFHRFARLKAINSISTTSHSTIFCEAGCWGKCGNNKTSIFPDKTIAPWSGSSSPFGSIKSSLLLVARWTIIPLPHFQGFWPVNGAFQENSKVTVFYLQENPIIFGSRHSFDERSRHISSCKSHCKRYHKIWTPIHPMFPQP